MKLNLGCGKDIKEGYVNLDIVDYGGNQIHNINSFPYPFPDNYFDEIFASHILEHIDNFNKTITELYRALQNTKAEWAFNCLCSIFPKHKIFR